MAKLSPLCSVGWIPVRNEYLYILRPVVLGLGSISRYSALHHNYLMKIPKQYFAIRYFAYFILSLETLPTEPSPSFYVHCA